MAHRPDLANTELASSQSGEDLARLKDLKGAFTGIWWYAKFPNHYSGDGSPATKEIGELSIKSKVKKLVETIQSVKADQKALELQDRFFNESEKPLNTKQ
jgi:creatinine amidohydrolase